MAPIPQPTDRLAYFGRVSTPKQRLEHHWDTVARWLERHGLTVLPDLRFEDKIRRHEAASMFRDWDKRKKVPGRRRYRFDAMMEMVEARQIDWILITSFDRWGITDRDEIFVFRSRLREYGVQLYSVVDELNITAADDSSFWRVAGAAEGATRYVSQQAEKNIEKMVSMAEGGWATTGNAPFGLDLVCYPVHDLTRPLLRVVRMRYKPHQCKVITYAPESRVERDSDGFITSSTLRVVSEVITDSMPPRDKKATGYRCEPSVESGRLDAVRMMFELYDAGMEFAGISDRLWEQGFKHYDKPFGYHGVETILSNSAYVGRPAWGKLGVGEYRHCLGKQPRQVQRKSADTVTVKKPEEEHVYPLRLIFSPIVPADLFERVKRKLQARPHVNATFGKRRTRDKASHPLNGKLHCPDCEEPMVLGSFCPGEKTHARRKVQATPTHCFHCGTWRKTIRKQCNANTVRWELLDEATATLLQTVKERIDRVTELRAAPQGEPAPAAALLKESWLRRSELGQILAEILAPMARAGDFQEADQVGEVPRTFPDQWVPPAEAVAQAAAKAAEGVESTGQLTQAGNLLDFAFAAYNRRFEERVEQLRVELRAIDAEIERLGELLVMQVPSATLRQKWFTRLGELEGRKEQIGPQLVPLTQKAEALLQQLDAVKDTIGEAEKTKLAGLLDTFLERVEPVFEVKEVGASKRRRTQVIGFRFVPRETAKDVLPEVMEIGCSRTGRGSWQQQG